MSLVRWVEVFGTDGFGYIGSRSSGNALATCASGTVLAVMEDTLVAAILAPEHRTIILCRFPLAHRTRGSGGLFVVDMPSGLNKALKFAKGGQLSMHLEGATIRIDLSRERRRALICPAKRIAGRMLSPSPPISNQERFTVEVADFRTALDRVRFAVKNAATQTSTLALVVSPKGAALWNYTPDLAIHQVLATATPTGAETQFCLFAGGHGRLSKILRQFRKSITVLVSSERLLLWDDHACVQIFSDVPQAAIRTLWVPLEAPGLNSSEVVMDECGFEQDGKNLKRLQSLLRARKTDTFALPPTRWLLTQNSVEIELRNCAATFYLEGGCRCNSWKAGGDTIEFGTEPAATAAILGAFAMARGPVSLLYQPRRFTVRSNQTGLEVVARPIQLRRRSEGTSAKVQNEE